MLVIDCDGTVKIIEDSILKYLYPVRLDHFDAGNNYVGKYSSLETLEENYKSLLYGLSIYLKKNEAIHIDYLPSDFNEEECMTFLSKYYKNNN